MSASTFMTKQKKLRDPYCPSFYKPTPKFKPIHILVISFPRRTQIEEFPIKEERGRVPRSTLLAIPGLESKEEKRAMLRRVGGPKVAVPPGYSFEKGINPKKEINDK